VVRADAFEDGRLLAIDGLGPDVADPQLGQQGGGEDAGLQVVADGDDGPVEVADTDLAQRVGVGGVGDDDLPELSGEPLDDVGAAVDGEHLGATTGQFEGECGAEPAEADDGDGLLVASQRWSSLRGAGGGGRARAAPARTPG
jgi:hypothetical protein